MAEIPNAEGDLRREVADLILRSTNICERARRQPPEDEIIAHTARWNFSDYREVAHWCQLEPMHRGVPPQVLIRLLDVFGPSPTTPAAGDQVNHPAHYGGDSLYEAIKVMEAWHGPEPVYWFCVLSAEKYQSRMGKKPGEPMARDAAKAAWYLAYAAKLREKIESEK